MMQTPLAPPAAQRLATTMLFLANGLCIGAWAASIPALKARFALTDGALSLALLAFAAGAVLSMPLAALAVPRFGTGRVTRIVALGFCASLFLPFAAGRFATLCLAAFVAGAANGAMDVSMNSHASIVERRWGSAIMSSFHAAYSGGGLLGAGLGAGLAVLGAAPAHVLEVAALAGLVLTLAAWKATGPGEIVASGSAFAMPGGAVLPLCAMALLCFMCEGAVGDWSAVYLESVAGASAAAATSGFAAYSATMLLGRLTGDWTIRRFGDYAIVRGGGALAALGLALAAAWPVPWVAAGGFALVGIGLANIVPAVFSATGRLGASPAVGIAMAATAGYGGLLGGPPVIGAIATAAGLRAGIVFLVFAAGLIVLLAGVMRRDGRAQL